MELYCQIVLKVFIQVHSALHELYIFCIIFRLYAQIKEEDEAKVLTDLYR